MSSAFEQTSRSNPAYDELKGILMNLLGHDRWNSGLSDERLAEKIAVTLDGVFSARRPVQSHEL
jgi:hypothetical protein